MIWLLIKYRKAFKMISIPFLLVYMMYCSDAYCLDMVKLLIIFVGLDFITKLVLGPKEYKNLWEGV